MKSLKILSIIMFCVMLKITAQTHYTVISNIDPVNPTNPPTGTLRWAIEQANLNPGLDYIDFNIPLGPPHIIQLASVLPVITDPIIIDGNTQPNNGTSGLYYKIAIKGDTTQSNIPYIFCLNKNYTWDPIIVDASTSEIRNLKIYETSYDGILLSRVEKIKILHNIIHSSKERGIRFSGASKCVMQGNIIGTDNAFNLDPYYSVKSGNLINGDNGLVGDSNLIGGLNAGEPNYFYNTNLASYNSAINISIGNYNKISGNVFINNSQNINLISKGCQGNMCHQPPVYQAVYLSGTTTASGTSGNNDFIELFKTNSGGIDAIQFLGSTTANSAGQWNVNLTGLNIGDTIIATATDEQGNTSSFSTGVIITEYVQPCCTDLSINAKSEQVNENGLPCLGNTIYLYASCGVQDYNWNFGDGNVLSTTGVNYVQHTYTVAGSYTLTISTNSTASCPAMTHTEVINIGDCRPPCCSNFHLSLRPGGDGPLPNLCASDSVPIYVFSPCEGMMYNLDFGDGTSADFSNFYGGSVIKHLYPTPNTYSIIVTTTATDGSCIPTSYTLVLTIRNCNPCIPTSTLSVVSSTVCLNQEICYVSEPRVCDPVSPNYSWNFGDGTPVLNSCGWCHTYTASGTYNLALTVSGSECITSTVSQQINVVSCDPPPPPCIDCIGSFAPNPDKTYIISAWVKEGNAPLTKTSYTYPNIIVGCPSVAFVSVAYTSSGAIIDGWQRIEGEFTIPALATDISIDLNCTSPSGDCYFDDIRVFPTDGSMKSYVYDPVNMRLVAELDERNYATLYEYDEEGKLVRVKKETEKGIMTIKENRNNSSK